MSDDTKTKPKRDDDLARGLAFADWDPELGQSRRRQLDPELGLGSVQRPRGDQDPEDG